MAAIWIYLCIMIHKLFFIINFDEKFDQSCTFMKAILKSIILYNVMKRYKILHLKSRVTKIDFISFVTSHVLNIQHLFSYVQKIRMKCYLIAWPTNKWGHHSAIFKVALEVLLQSTEHFWSNYCLNLIVKLR